jgi:hypothetical protein
MVPSGRGRVLKKAHGLECLGLGQGKGIRSEQVDYQGKKEKGQEAA